MMPSNTMESFKHNITVFRSLIGQFNLIEEKNSKVLAMCSSEYVCDGFPDTNRWGGPSNIKCKLYLVI